MVSHFFNKTFSCIQFCMTRNFYLAFWRKLSHWVLWICYLKHWCQFWICLSRGSLLWFHVYWKFGWRTGQANLVILIRCCMFCKARVIVCITLVGLGWLFLFANAVNGMRYYGHNGEHIFLEVVQMLTIIVFLSGEC